MMRVKVEICYAAESQNHPLDVEVKDGLKGARLMNAIEKAVERKLAEMAKDNATYSNWQRWNLVSL